MTGAQQWRRLRDNGHIWMRACMDECKIVCMCTMLASPSRSCSLFQAARRSAATAAPRFESYCTPSSAGWPRFWGELAMALGREPCKSIFIQFPSPPPHLLKPILSREHASRAASFRGSRLLSRSACLIGFGRCSLGALQRVAAGVPGEDCGVMRHRARVFTRTAIRLAAVSSDLAGFFIHDIKIKRSHMPKKCFLFNHGHQFVVILSNSFAKLS